jgi:phenylacetaldehyde dehydrogenase
MDDIVDVDQTHRLVQEEIFGPVLVAMPFDDIDEVVRLAASAGAQGEGR